MSARRLFAEARTRHLRIAIGSYRDKVERIRAIARWFTEQWFNLGMLHAHVAEADRAAELAKCDLATEMVREFTELQGIVAVCTRALRANPTKSPTPSTITTVRRA